jgi:hypothetical protein
MLNDNINKMKNLKPIKITKEQILTMERATSRNIELENNLRINHHRVHKSKKTYSRQENKKISNFF